MSVVLNLFVALMLPGIIVRTRALLAGRKGAPFYQHISRLGALLCKAPVYSSATGFVFRLAPVVYLASTVAAMLLVPVGDFSAVLAFNGDIVLFCYLLALGRVMLILAAMETGSSIDGMGASREALYGALLEPALFLVAGTLALVSDSLSFSQVFAGVGSGTPEMVVVMVLVMYALFKIMLVEAGRIPVDDPRTHLELTMIHEAMVLDYSGFDLALITLAGWSKAGLLAVLAASAFASVLYWDTIVVLLLGLAAGLAIGIVESFLARSRMARNSTYIVTILAVALVAFVIAFLLLNQIRIG
ncbi:respiratory chain complex I subunit 1 family protein [Alistipes indistinctus]|uniref:respiratory chain complex I subunit 1 family protein n=1 Tax=Alistipes indistinctus TaxID=626932 RepID=UPI0015F22BB4|nr:NADH-quinone oxidoreductase subunit H [Alistipes indistinctus]BCG54879.1 hydrogenase [Alistipes indistinctus]